MKRVPKRRWETVAGPLLMEMNEAFDAVISIEEDPIRGTKNAAEVRYRSICRALDRIAKAEMPLWIWWDTSMQEEEDS